MTLSKGFVTIARRSVVTAIFRLKGGKWPGVLFDEVTVGTAWCAQRVDCSASWGIRLARVTERCRPYKQSATG
ncbi:MAG: hypothetical protein HRU17_24240 [Polyangiaceae bacterium]|nr:hypothetical protein [Polyangiaceae bacterium]